MFQLEKQIFWKCIVKACQKKKIIMVLSSKIKDISANFGILSDRSIIGWKKCLIRAEVNALLYYV